MGAAQRLVQTEVDSMFENSQILGRFGFFGVPVLPEDVLSRSDLSSKVMVSVLSYFLLQDSCF